MATLETLKFDNLALRSLPIDKETQNVIGPFHFLSAPPLLRYRDLRGGGGGVFKGHF